MKNRKDDIIYVYYELPNYGRNVLAQNFDSLAGRDKTHIEVITKEEDYNKLVSENKEVYLFYNNTYSNSIDINSLNIVYKETCMNDITSALYTK